MFTGFGGVIMKDYHVDIFYSAEAEGYIPDTEAFHTNWTGRGGTTTSQTYTV